MVVFSMMGLLVPVLARGEDEPSITIGGLVAGAYQIEVVDGIEGALDGGAVPFQLDVAHAATPYDYFHASLGFAAGKGLNGGSSFRVSPWAANTEDDVKNINGRNRDYLLTAWYRRSITLGPSTELALTGGIIDGTDYLDANAFANDEYSQFMNSALVNGPNFFAPSYDIGGAVVFDTGPWSLRGVVMEVGANDDGRPFAFYGLEAGFRLATGLGEGNYRVGLCGTSDEFDALRGDGSVARQCYTASFDQELGSVLGAWLRFGVQDHAALVDYANLWSGGLNFSGSGWGRQEDNVGLGLARLNNGNNDLKDTHVWEVYYRVGLGNHLGVTLDVQHLQDHYFDGSEVRGMIYGVRMTAAF